MIVGQLHRKISDARINAFLYAQLSKNWEDCINKFVHVNGLARTVMGEVINYERCRNRKAPF